MRATRKKTQLQGWGIAVLRVVTGYLFLASGVNKLFIEDPRHLDGSLLPMPIILGSSLAELLCGVALIVGLLTRWVSIPLAILMLADVVVVHPPSEFFEQDYGYEYALLRLAASVALVSTGSGKVALDNIILANRRRQ
jgi:putative oxidoreductase